MIKDIARKLPRWPAPPQLAPELMQKLELHGADALRGLLISSTDGYSGTSRNTKIDFGNGSAQRGEIQDWLKWRAAVDAWWVKAGVVAASAAALLSLIAVVTEWTSAPIHIDSADRSVSISSSTSNMTTALIAGVIGFAVGLFQTKLKEWGNKRNYSKLGVAIIETLIGEINIGIEILRKNEPHALPNSSWQGMETVPDNVLLRIVALDNGYAQPSDRWPVSSIRLHCKNYFVYICGNANSGTRPSQYADDATRVRNMLADAKRLLEANSGKWFPK